MDYTKFDTSQVYTGKSRATYDVGLRSYMIAVYKHMSIALLITSVIAYLVSVSPTMQMLALNPISFIGIAIATIAIAVYMGSRILSLSVEKARNFLWLYAALIGLTLSSLFIIYTGASVAKAFLITASTFGAMSLYGYTTRRDLTAVASFLFMGLFGIVIASLVNMFLYSGRMSFIISIASVVVFTGLAAYDTQKIKDLYYQVAGRGDVENKVAVYGAFSLYLDFINLFMSLIRLVGERKE
ncbi:putative Bax1-I family protein YbhL [Alphaproteobacteria bacterium]